MPESTKMQESTAQESTFSSAGRQLFRRTWRTESAKAGIVLMHGLFEHSARYDHVASALNQAGYDVFAFDIHAHGKSSGTFGLVENFQQCINDYQAFHELIQQENPNLELFLMGHSFGGAIVARYALTKSPKAKGFVLSSPLLQLADDVSSFLVFISGFLGTIAPKLPTIPLDSSGISRDPAVVAKYAADPLVYSDKMPAGTGKQVVNAAKWFNDQLQNFDQPFYVYHGTEDALTNVKGSQALYDQAKSEDKTIKLYEGLFHETMNEPEKETVIGDLVSWLDQRA